MENDRDAVIVTAPTLTSSRRNWVWFAHCNTMIDNKSRYYFSSCQLGWNFFPFQICSSSCLACISIHQVTEVTICFSKRKLNGDVWKLKNKQTSSFKNTLVLTVYFQNPQRPFQQYGSGSEKYSNCLMISFFFKQLSFFYFLNITG